MLKVNITMERHCLAVCSVGAWWQTSQSLQISCRWALSLSSSSALDISLLNSHAPVWLLVCWFDTYLSSCHCHVTFLCNVHTIYCLTVLITCFRLDNMAATCPTYFSDICPKSWHWKGSQRFLSHVRSALTLLCTKTIYDTFRSWWFYQVEFHSGHTHLQCCFK